MRDRRLTNAAVGLTCGVSPNAVRQWRYRLIGPNPHFVRVLEQRLGIPRHLLRPDIYESPPQSGRRPANRNRRSAERSAEDGDSEPGTQSAVA